MTARHRPRAGRLTERSATALDVRSHAVTPTSRLHVPRLPTAPDYAPLQALREVGVQALERHALLAHRVAVAHGDGAVVERVEVDRDAERRADLVLAAVAAADRAGVVEVDVPLAAQVVGDLARDAARAARCATAAARRP